MNDLVILLVCAVTVAGALVWIWSWFRRPRCPICNERMLRVELQFGHPFWLCRNDECESCQRPIGVRCRLCGGLGDDVTGLALNGNPQSVCVRCGGYGKIPARCNNPSERVRDKEIESLTTQDECGAKKVRLL